MPRDVAITRAVYRYRFLRPAHIHALLGNSPAKIAKRMRLLWQHGYLERPRALRPTRALTEELVYALGKKGAQHLAHVDPKLRAIGTRGWSEEPKRSWTLPYVDHELLVADFGVALEVACREAGLQLFWPAHAELGRYHLKLANGKTQRPDAYFRLGDRVSGLHCFLEADRVSVSLPRMRERYANYFLWWQAEGSTRRAQGAPPLRLRVLTITTDPDYVDSLRRIAREIGVTAHHPKPWRGLLFAHAGTLDLRDPARALQPIFHYADQEAPVALL
jgi:hypothetical protein